MLVTHTYTLYTLSLSLSLCCLLALSQHTHTHTHTKEAFSVFEAEPGSSLHDWLCRDVTEGLQSPCTQTHMRMSTETDHPVFRTPARLGIDILHF